MQSRRPALKHQLAINLYVGYVSLLTLVYGVVFFTHIARQWLLSEWLISYQGGFVRRGLPGEAAYLLGRISHLSPVFFVVLFNLALYAVLFLAIRRLALDSSQKLWVLALLFSPATLAFQLLDLIAGFHKELIYLAALSLFVVMLQRYRLSSAAVTGYLCVALLLTTFSHEPLICFAPYFFAALMLAGRSFGQAARVFVVPLALGLLAAFVCTRHLGNMHTAIQICSSLGYTLNPAGGVDQICSGGAIAYLGYTREMAAQQVQLQFKQDHLLALYPALALLALVPAVAGSLVLRRSGCRQEMRIVWYAAAISFVGSLILFIFGADWGRWIYIHVMSITLLLLVVDGRARERSAAEAEPALLPRGQRMVAAVALLLYSTLWTLPHFNENAPHFGYISLARSLATLPQRYARSRQARPVAAVAPGATPSAGSGQR